MASRHALWLAATLAVVATIVLIHTPSGRSNAPAATDVLFVFDTTGSMSGALSEAQGQATSVMSDLSGRLPSLRFGVAQLRDYGSTPVWRVEQELSADRASVQAAIDSLNAGEGGDSPEAYGTGLLQSRSDPAVGWAPGAKHLVVLIADDVPHDDDLNAGVPAEIVNQPSPWDTGTDEGPTGTGIDWQQELADFAAADYTLAYVLYHGDPAYLPYWDWWARQTGGQATESTSSTPLGDVLVQIITATTSTCRSDTEDDPPQCDADEAPAFSSELPALPAVPDPVDSSDPDAPNDGVVPGSCPPRPGPTSDPQDIVQPTDVTAGSTAQPPGDPWECLDSEGTPPVVPGVTWTENPTAIRFRNADGVWTIYKRCIDAVSGGRRYTVGPGYIARLERNGVAIVDDFRGRSDTWSPGFINAVNGGLGTFGWHHARGPVNGTPAGDDPTTPAVETATGRTPQVIEGRMCAATNGEYGVYARNWYAATRVSPSKVNYTIDVWLRDRYGNTGVGPLEAAITRIRYRYTFRRSSVSLWALVTTYAAPNAAGTPFVKEPKFTALTRGGGFSRIASFNGADGREFAVGVLKGEPEGTAVLDTDHSSADGRKRVRWDFETKSTATEGSPRCTTTAPCLNVVARSFPTTTAPAGILRTEPAANWEGSGIGLDRWAVISASRAKSYPRDTWGDNSVSRCKTPPRATDDLDGKHKVDVYELSKASERAAPDMDQVREWELGGWKSGPDSNPYHAALTLFPAWENGRGGWDCEPLQRQFGPSGESWGSYFSYSLNDGWTLSG
jgi:hypothetical protein